MNGAADHDGDFRRAAADIDIHAVAVMLGAEDGARAVRAEDRFEVGAGGGADEMPRPDRRARG